MSVLSLARNGTSVAFTCSGDSDPSRQPKPLLQSSGVSLLTDQTRSGTYRMQADWRVTVEVNSSVNKLAGFPLTDHNDTRGWSYVINRRCRASCRLHRGRQDIEGIRARRTGTVTSSSRTRSRCIESENTATGRHCRVHTHTAG